MRLAAIGVGVALFIGAFVFFLHQADVLAPAPHEISTPLPNAFNASGE